MTGTDTYPRVTLYDAGTGQRAQPYAAGGPPEQLVIHRACGQQIVRCGGHAVRLCRPWVSAWGLALTYGLQLSSD